MWLSTVHWANRVTSPVTVYGNVTASATGRRGEPAGERSARGREPTPTVTSVVPSSWDVAGSPLPGWSVTVWVFEGPLGEQGGVAGDGVGERDRVPPVAAVNQPAKV